VLVLPTLSRGHSHNGLYKHQGLMGTLTSAWQGLRVGDTPTMEGFTARRANREGTHRLVFASPPPSGGYPTMGHTRVGTDGDTPINMVARKWLGVKRILFH